jgi:hypothetical protein
MNQPSSFGRQARSCNFEFLRRASPAQDDRASSPRPSPLAFHYTTTSDFPRRPRSRHRCSRRRPAGGLHPAGAAREPSRRRHAPSFRNPLRPRFGKVQRRRGGGGIRESPRPSGRSASVCRGNRVAGGAPPPGLGLSSGGRSDHRRGVGDETRFASDRRRFVASCGRWRGTALSLRAARFDARSRSDRRRHRTPLRRGTPPAVPARPGG